MIKKSYKKTNNYDVFYVKSSKLGKVYEKERNIFMWIEVDNTGNYFCIKKENAIDYRREKIDDNKDIIEQGFELFEKYN